MSLNIEEEKKDSQIKIKPLKLIIDQPLTKRNISPFPNFSGFRMILVGPPRSGKTTLMTSLICSHKKPFRVYRKAFHHIFVISPMSSMSSIQNCAFLNPDEMNQEKVFTDISADLLWQLINRMEANKEENETSLLILDDFASSLKNSDIEKALNHLLANARHLMVSIMILTQAIKFVPLRTRQLVSHWIFFKPNHKLESKNVFEEILGISKEKVDTLFDFVFRNPHDFLLVSTVDGILFRNLNRLKLSS